MSLLVAIVDDEDDISELIKLHLTRSGFKTRSFSNGKDFLEYHDQCFVDFLVLDLMLPDMSGLEICKQIRKSKQHADLPILMLTAKSSESDKIKGLELGADDYLSKPFSVHELAARVQSIMRRTIHKGKLKKNYIRISDDIEMDIDRFDVFLKGKEVKLTKSEFQILHALAEAGGKVLSRKKLLHILWGDEKIVVERSIDVHIRHIRKKLEEAGQVISNVSGIGYKIEL